MNYPRAFNTLQMLADGTVLAVGGETETALPNGEGEVSGGVLPAEIWNPSTGQWTTVASMAVTRGYHTTSLLLPSGQVLIAGSGHAAPGDPGQYSAQIYSPPYLFKGARPTISSMSSSTTYGSSFTVNTPDASSIQSVNLVDLGTSTHQMDFVSALRPAELHRRLGQPDRPDAGQRQLRSAGQLHGVHRQQQRRPVGGRIHQRRPRVGRLAGRGPGRHRLDRRLDLEHRLLEGRHRPRQRGHELHRHPVRGHDGAGVNEGVRQPGADLTTITGLKSGTQYTFKVTATNAQGTGRASKPSKAVRPTAVVHPTFIQRASSYADTTTRLPLTFGAVTRGDRLVVQTSTWGDGGSAAAVTDSSGDHFTELFSGRAADGTEMSVWTAPITARTGARPVITVTPSWKADVGAVAVEYAGVSSAPGAGSVDQIIAAGGVTHGRGLVSSGATAPSAGAGELAVGLYADSGFGDTVTAGSGERSRFDLSRTRTMMEQLVEARVVSAGTRVTSTAHTGARTPWMMATIVFRAAGAAVPATQPARAPNAGQRAAQLRRLLRAFTAAHAAAAKHPVLPLSQRPRTHALAGAISTYTGLTGDFTALYYCLVSVANQ